MGKSSCVSEPLQFKSLAFKGQMQLQYIFFLWQELLPSSVQFSSVTQSCPTLCDPMNRSVPGLPVHHHLPEFTKTHVYQVGDGMQPSHLLSSPSPPAPNPSQHQSLFQWVNSSHEVAKVLEFQPQHQSFQWTLKTGSGRSPGVRNGNPLQYSCLENSMDGGAW